MPLKISNNPLTKFLNYILLFTEFVDKCYWGDDQKGYEALTCLPDGKNNKACKKVKCLDGNTKVDPETGLAGNGMF